MSTTDDPAMQLPQVSAKPSDAAKQDDVAAINRLSGELNREAEDALEYQLICWEE